MVPASRRYAIINYSSLTTSMISDLLQTSKSSCRRSESGVDRAIVSWNGKKPESIGDVTVYTHAQMLALVKDEDGDWYADPEATS